MKKYNRKKGSILLYVMLLINIALVVGIVVFNNSYVVINNIDVGSNQEEVFTNIFNKGTISLKTINKYNSNGGGFLDGISCPQDITMSGTVFRGENISTDLIYENGKVHCEGTYRGDDFRILYDDDVNDFNIAQFDDDIVNIVESSGNNINLSTTDISSTASIQASNRYNNSYDSSNTVDNNTSTEYISKSRNGQRFIRYRFSGERNIGRMIIRKRSFSTTGNTWDRADINLRDSSGDIVDYASVTGVRNQSYIQLDFNYRGLVGDVREIEIRSRGGYLVIGEVEVYELNSTGSEDWEGDQNFNDSDNTKISFSKDGIEGNDGIDDDLNSDNYKVTSIGDIYFPGGYQDDDVVPRTTIFGSVLENTDYQHIYWSNYKTIDVIENNINNNDTLNVKMGDINEAYMFLNTFNVSDQDYNIKILEFDRAKYRDEFTLLPLNSYEGKNLTEYMGYIQENPDGTLGISEFKTGNEFEFDFENIDYAIFIANNADSNLSFHLDAETPSGQNIYINPIDDSGTGTISVLANHIIIGGEKNFIGENFEMVGPK